MSSVCVCIMALDSRDRQAKGTGAKLLAAIEVTRIPARLKALEVALDPSQLVHYASDIVFATVWRASTFNQDQPMRPQHPLISVVVNLTLDHDEPGSFISHSLHKGVQLGGIAGGGTQHEHLRLRLFRYDQALQRASDQRVCILIS